MTILRSTGARLLAAAILTLLWATNANGALLVLDRAESHIDIAVKSTFSNFIARVETFDLAVTLDPASGKVESTAFHANLASVKTGREDRDHNMNVWLQTDKFPQVVFVLGVIDRGPDRTWTARGTVQLHGQKRDVTFPVTVTVSQGQTTIDGTVTLDTRDFGLPIVLFLMLTVEPVVHVHFHIQGA